MPNQNAMNRNLTGNDNFLDNDFGIDYTKVALEHGKALDIALGLEKKFYDTVDKLDKNSELKKMKRQLNNDKLTVAEREKIESDYLKLKEDLENRAMDVINKYSENIMKRGSAAQRAEIAKNAAEKIKAAAQAADEEFRINSASMNKNGTEYKELQEQRIKQIEEFAETAAKIEQTQRQLTNTQVMKSMTLMGSGIEDIINKNYKSGMGKVVAGLANFSIKDIAKNLTDQAEASRELLKQKEEEYSQLLELDPEKAKEKEEELSKYRKEVQKDEAKAFGAKAAEAVVDAIGASYDKAFGEAENFLTSYSAHMNARLQGTDETFDKITDLVTSNLSTSPYVRTTEVLNRIKEASDQGIAYNLELRAFLGEISDKIASTFDAFDSNLTRLIRIQQADSTAARLGMEASLTRFFNSMYEDSSYLSGLSDSVAGAILDAESQLNKEAAAEFEYTVQKWLGSLSSLGMSEQAITNIAQGINYLATGDVTSLSSNTSLQTLFAMSANRSGLSYAELLTGGLNASNTNKLLQSMVEYLKEIAEGADNQVVKGAYGNIFNLSLSDLQSISNLTSNDISTIAGNVLSYSGMQSELNSQLNQVVTRMSLPEFMSNVYNNAMYGLASDMVNNPVTYATQKMLDFAKGIGADISIPFVSAAGFGFDPNASVLDLVNMGLNIVKVMDLVGNIFSGLGSRGGINLSSWGGTETTARGGAGNLLSSMIGGLSGSQTVYRANYNTSDTTSQTLAEATERGEENKKITNKGKEEDEDDAKDANKALAAASSLKGNGSEWLWVRDSLLNLVYINSDRALRVKDEPLVSVFTGVMGKTPVTTAGTVRVSVAPGSELLNVLVRNNEALPVKITNVGELATTQVAASQKQTQVVSISGGIKIDKETIVESIIEALGLQGELDVVSLGDYISAATDPTRGLVITGKDNGVIPVNIDSVSGTLSNGIPVKVR